MKVEARGWTFDVRQGGPEDGPVVLLLHGFPQHGGAWDRVAARLQAEGYRTIAPDQRGYSPGARPDEVDAYRIAECAADARALLGALGVPAAHVVGHDWGSLVGWQLAGRDAEWVRTLTAVSVPHPIAFAAALAGDADQRERSAYMGLFRIPGKAEETLLSDDAAALRGIFAGSTLDPAGVHSYVAPLREPGALTAALNWYRAMSPTDAIGLGAAACPTTFVWSDADADVAVGRTAAERCADHVSGPYRFVPLPGVSHWILDQVPDVLADAVIDRVRSTD